MALCVIAHGSPRGLQTQNPFRLVGSDGVPGTGVETVYKMDSTWCRWHFGELGFSAWTLELAESRACYGLPGSMTTTWTPKVCQIIAQNI